RGQGSPPPVDQDPPPPALRRCIGGATFLSATSEPCAFSLIGASSWTPFSTPFLRSSASRILAFRSSLVMDHSNRRGTHHPAMHRHRWPPICSVHREATID